MRRECAAAHTSSGGASEAAPTNPPTHPSSQPARLCAWRASELLARSLGRLSTCSRWDVEVLTRPTLLVFSFSASHTRGWRLRNSCTDARREIWAQIFPGRREKNSPRPRELTCAFFPTQVLTMASRLFQNRCLPLK